MPSDEKGGITGFLDEDPKIKRQQFVCLSMLCPSDDKMCDKTYFEIREYLTSEFSNHFKDETQFDVKFKLWREQKQAELDDLYNEKQKGLSMPIIKVRGSYKTLSEAKYRCKHLGKWDKTCNIFVAQVGRWVPADGKVRKTETEIYHAEQEMQKFMKARKEAKEAADKEFELRIATAKQKKLDDLAEKALEEEEEEKNIITKTV